MEDADHTTTHRPHDRDEAQMRQRTDATLAFYIALSPEQQQVFDANAMRMGGMNSHHGMRGRGGDMQHKHS